MEDKKKLGHLFIVTFFLFLIIITFFLIQEMDDANDPSPPFNNNPINIDGIIVNIEKSTFNISEPIKIEVINNLDQPVWFPRSEIKKRSMPTSWCSLQKYSNNKWVNIIYTTKIFDNYSVEKFDSNSTLMDMWNQKIYKSIDEISGSTVYLTNISEGTYRFSFKYSYNEDISDLNTTYSDEFIIS